MGHFGTIQPSREFDGRGLKAQPCLDQSPLRNWISIRKQSTLCETEGGELYQGIHNSRCPSLVPFLDPINQRTVLFLDVDAILGILPYRFERCNCTRLLSFSFALVLVVRGLSFGQGRIMLLGIHRMRDYVADIQEHRAPSWLDSNHLANLKQDVHLRKFEPDSSWDLPNWSAEP